MHKTVVINAVGLSQRLLPHLPSVQKLGQAATIGHVLPAVTCSVQATYLTGTMPREHGIVGNGWYFKNECEVRFWHQSDKLVQRPRIWEIARERDPSFTCANLFWWNAMYSTADITVTPRPMYPADGRKLPDVWTNPPELRFELQRKLGQFPLFRFWGPATSIESSQWIANAAIEVDRTFNPTLSLIYLPHLDYCLQRLGPNDPGINADLGELDGVLRQLIDHYRSQARTRIIVLSEYGIEPVSRPIHVNRALRQQNLLSVRNELGRELMDAGASRAFAVADHQIAHVYVNDRGRLEQVHELLRSTPGIERVLNRRDQAEAGLDHPRSGDLVAVAKQGAWFTYYYWLDDDAAPDYARTVDIHRKPGYDPVELFFDPAMRMRAWKMAAALLKRKLGFRSLLKLIPLDAGLVRGSHGRPPAEPDGPLLITSEGLLLGGSILPSTEVLGLILRHLVE